MSPVLRQDLLRSAPLLLPAGALAVFLLGARLVLSLLVPGQPLETAYPEWVLIALTPLAWLIVRELGVREWTDGGHAAREALPLRPLRVYLEKVLCGATLLAGLAMVGAMLLSTTLRVLRQADTSLPDLLLNGAGAWLACAYGALWLLAAFGRHRHAVGAWALVLLLGADRVGLLPWRSLPPLRLAADGLLGPDERLLGSALAGVAMLVLAGLPWCVRGGRLTRRWSGPARRGDLLAGGLALALLVLVPALARAGAAPALRLEGEVIAAGTVRVRAPQAEASRAASTALADSAALALVPLAEEVGLDPPEVGIELARGQHGFLRAELRGRSGLLVRADWLEPEFAPEAFQAWLLREALDEATRGRLRSAPWRWLLDGWPAWRAGAAPPAAQPEVGLRVAFAARGLDAAGLLGPGLFARWDEVRAALGEELARELAAWVVGELARQGDPALPSALLREAADRRLGALSPLAAGEGALARCLRRAGGGELRALEERLAGAARGLAQTEAGRLEGCAAPDWEGFRLEPLARPGGAWLRLQVPSGRAGPAALLVAPDAGGLPERWDRGELLPGDEPLELGPWPSGSWLWVTWTRPCAGLGGVETIAGWRRVRLP